MARIHFAVAHAHRVRTAAPLDAALCVRCPGHWLTPIAGSPPACRVLSVSRRRKAFVAAAMHDHYRERPRAGVLIEVLPTDARGADCHRAGSRHRCSKENEGRGGGAAVRMACEVKTARIDAPVRRPGRRHAAELVEGPARERKMGWIRLDETGA